MRIDRAHLSAVPYNSTPSELLKALHAEAGLICFAGAGGKKSTLYHLASAHPGRIGITSTVLTPPFPTRLAAFEVVAEEGEIGPAVVKAAAGRRIVAFATPSVKRNRLGGLSPSQVAEIHRAAGFDITLIKCDGARGRWMKAPGEDEPAIPERADTVIPVISARAIGQPLSERIAHRMERVAAITGARAGDLITPRHVARLLASEQGAMKGVGAATVVPLINMVDDAKLERFARYTARQALELTDRFERVVLTCMRRVDPIVDIVGSC
jgi:probable selenium-dependent hydroxylase accessory protein YqeC